MDFTYDFLAKNRQNQVKIYCYSSNNLIFYRVKIHSIQVFTQYERLFGLANFDSLINSEKIVAGVWDVL